MNLPNTPERAAGRRMLLLLVAALALPFIVAAVLIFSGWRPAVAPHTGELMPPATTPMALADLQISAGPQQSALAGRWLLVSVESQACAVDCSRRLEALRRLHVALYKAMPRVKRVLLAPDVPVAPAIVPPDVTVAAMTSWPALDRPGIYLVDPHGQAVLRYEQGAEPKAMLKDVERLLRYSWSG
jgi:hypothetical protein